MQIDDQDLFKWVSGAVMSVLALFTRRQIKQMDDTKRELDEHKLYAAKNYIEKDALDRVHERIDEMGSDIKTLLTRVGQGKP